MNRNNECRTAKIMAKEKVGQKFYAKNSPLMT